MSEHLLAALTAIDQAVTSDEYGQLLVAAKCRGLMRGYNARWINVGYQVEAVESLLQSDLYNPETQRKSRSFTVAGLLDTVLLMDGRRILVDHKTTSEDISDPTSPYWRQLVVESQPTHYMLLEWLNGIKADSAMWDVVRKPQISPKKLSRADQQSVGIRKQYFGVAVSYESLLELGQTERETLEMYEARLSHDCTHERPQWYFQRRPVPRLDSDLHEYATDLWGHSQELLHARREKRHPRNSGACMLYHSPCQFLGICSGYDTPDSENWAPKLQVHSELPGLPGDGRDVLTNTRIRTFQTCRRKHYFSYELGIERLDEEEKEALFFGTVFHAGLAAWFLSLKGEGNDNYSGSTGTGSVSAPGVAVQETLAGGDCIDR